MIITSGVISINRWGLIFIPSLPLPSLPSPSCLPLPSFFPISVPSLPLEVGPLKSSYRVCMGSAVSSPSPAGFDFGAF